MAGSFRPTYLPLLGTKRLNKLKLSPVTCQTDRLILKIPR